MIDRFVDVRRKTKVNSPALSPSHPIQDRFRTHLGPEAAGSRGDRWLLGLRLRVGAGRAGVGTGGAGGTVWADLAATGGNDVVIRLGRWLAVFILVGGAGGLALDRVAGRRVLADGRRAAHGRRGGRGDLTLDDGGHVGLEHDLRAGDGRKGGAGEGADAVGASGKIGQLGRRAFDLGVLAVGGLGVVVGDDAGRGHGGGQEDRAEDFG